MSGDGGVVMKENDSIESQLLVTAGELYRLCWQQTQPLTCWPNDIDIVSLPIRLSFQIQIQFIVSKIDSSLPPPSVNSVEQNFRFKVSTPPLCLSLRRFIHFTFTLVIVYKLATYDNVCLN